MHMRQLTKKLIKSRPNYVIGWVLTLLSRCVRYLSFRSISLLNLSSEMSWMENSLENYARLHRIAWDGHKKISMFSKLSLY